jgi:hypothetical protein
MLIPDPAPKKSEGKSSRTKDRNVGEASEPETGPAKTLFATWVVSVPVSVPLDVTGEPETEKIDPGKLNPTLIFVEMIVVGPVFEITTPVPPVRMEGVLVPLNPINTCPSPNRGMSAFSRDRKVGVPLAPSGDANIKFGD